MPSRLIKLLEAAVLRSILPNSRGQEIFNFLNRNPTVADPSDLPEGRIKRKISQLFECHIHVEDPAPGPTIEQSLMNRPRNRHLRMRSSWRPSF